MIDNPNPELAWLVLLARGLVTYVHCHCVDVTSVAGICALIMNNFMLLMPQPPPLPIIPLILQLQIIVVVKNV